MHVKDKIGNCRISLSLVDVIFFQTFQNPLARHNLCMWSEVLFEVLVLQSFATTTQGSTLLASVHAADVSEVTFQDRDSRILKQA